MHRKSIDNLSWYLDQGGPLGNPVRPTCDFPFHTLDTEGVGELLRIGVDRARQIDPDIVLSICGEHGGSPESIAFCRQIGMDYVSCSPFRVPVAKLAAAQLAIVSKTG